MTIVYSEDGSKKTFSDFIDSCEIIEIVVALNDGRYVVFFPHQVRTIFSSGFSVHKGGGLEAIVSFDMIKEIMTMSIIESIHC